MNTELVQEILGLFITVCTNEIPFLGKVYASCMKA